MGLLYLSFAYNCYTIAEPLLLYLRRNTIEDEKKKKKKNDSEKKISMEAENSSGLMLV